MSFLRLTLACALLSFALTRAHGADRFVAGANVTPTGGSHTYYEDHGTTSASISGGAAGYSYDASATSAGASASINVKFTKGAGLQDGDAGAIAELDYHTGKFIPAGKIAHITMSITAQFTGSMSDNAVVSMSVEMDPENGWQAQISQFKQNGEWVRDRLVDGDNVIEPGTPTINLSSSLTNFEYDRGPSMWSNEFVVRIRLTGSVPSDGGSGEVQATINLSGINISMVLEDPPEGPPASEMVWTNPAGGSFGTEANWTPEQVPVKNDERADTAAFLLVDTYPVSVGSRTNERLLVGDGHVTLEVENYELTSLSQSNPSVMINRDAILQLKGNILKSKHTVIGGTAAGNQSAEVWMYNSDLTWLNWGRFVVGGSGRGGLALTGGPSLVSLESRIGDYARGEVRIGDGSTWLAANLVVGNNADGLLEIDAGGTVDGDIVILGFKPDTRGEILLGGKPATSADDRPYLHVTDTLNVGFEGEGNLVVKGGGHILTDALGIISNVETQGGVLVEGSAAGFPSEIIAKTIIEVGTTGSGRLTILDGGRVDTPKMLIGQFHGYGEVVVGGGLSTVATLDVGFMIVGSSNVSQGVLSTHTSGNVFTGVAEVGKPNAPEGWISRVEVLGPDSFWAIETLLILWDSGVLKVTEGSTVIGQAAGIPGWVVIGTGGHLAGSGRIICPGALGGLLGGASNFSGTVGPGNSPGTLTIEGHYTQGAAGVLAIEIGGLETGFNHDRLVVTGDATFAPGAKIRVTFIDPNPEDAVAETFIPRTGDVFNFLAAAAINLPTGASLADHIEFTNLPAGVVLAFDTVTENGVTRVRATTTAAPPPAGPRIAAHPHAALVSAGSSPTFTVAVEGATTTTYQWRYDGVDIPGATGASYTLPSAQTFHAGSFSVVAIADGVPLASRSAAINVTAAAPSDARLLNLSTRAQAFTGDDVLIPGFVIAGNGSKRLLIRAVGPTLAQDPFNLSGVLPDPRLRLLWQDPNTQQYVEIAANDNWRDNANAAEITQTSADLSAFGLNDDNEAALLLDVSPGQYTAIADGADGQPGLAIVELYDADPAGDTPTARLINISNRGFAGVGAQVMIPGFVVSSEGPRTFLIRVVGPTLAAFGVTGTMVDPQLTIYSGQTALFGNNDWETNSDGVLTAQIAEQVSAFPLTPGSKDAAMVVTLAPGSYTVIGSSAVSGATGVVLVEVYAVE